MKQIRIGTCVPGEHIFTWGKPLATAGYECLAINYHMECGEKDLPEFAARVKDNLGDTPISSIGYYCNALVSEEQRKTLERFIVSARAFGTDLVTTFAGAVEGDSVEAAVPAFKTVYGELAKRAEAAGVRIAFENCAMGGTWQRNTCNIAFNPKAWELMFDAVPSDSLGLEWEPAHQQVQLIDPLPQLRDWAGKVFHVHGKDANIDMDAVRRWGVFGAHEFAVSRTPGFGDTDWRDIFHILMQNGFDGDICVEGYHDPLYSGELEMTGQLHALNYLRWCRGGEFTANPW